MRAEQLSLVFIPGLVCDEAVFADQVRVLSDLGPCHVVDHGSLDSIPAMAQAVLLASLPRFAMIGHSMGGRVALEVLRTAPERVTGIALLDTGYQARPAGEAGEREVAERMELLELARARGMRAMGQKWVRGMVHPQRLSDAPLIESILAMIERKTTDIFAAQIRALLDRPEAGPLLTSIDCPTLLLCGREDSWSPLARHEQMAKMIPGSTLVIIEESGHMSPMERPREVSAALREWLERALN
jgi:pimeloyl-ACP methyl ester carboxylesterase